MRERRAIRAFVTYNHTQYFLDGAEQKGVLLRAAPALPEAPQPEVQDRQPSDRDRDHPGDARAVARAAGRGLRGSWRWARSPSPISARRWSTSPTLWRTKIEQIVVTGPAGPATLAGLDDLAGREVWVRPASAELDSLRRLEREPGSEGRRADRDPDRRSEARGRGPARDGQRRPLTAPRSSTATWLTSGRLVFTEIRRFARSGARATDVKLAIWAVRKGTPELMAEVNKFVKGEPQEEPRPATSCSSGIWVPPSTRATLSRRRTSVASDDAHRLLPDTTPTAIDSTG